MTKEIVLDGARLEELKKLHAYRQRALKDVSDFAVASHRASSAVIRLEGDIENINRTIIDEHGEGASLDLTTGIITVKPEEDAKS